MHDSDRDCDQCNYINVNVKIAIFCVRARRDLLETKKIDRRVSHRFSNLQTRDFRIDDQITHRYPIRGGKDFLTRLDAAKLRRLFRTLTSRTRGARISLTFGRGSTTSCNAETFILPFGRNPAYISLASMSREGRRKHMAVQRCTKAAVGPPCLHKLFARPKKIVGYRPAQHFFLELHVVVIKM